ncbi:MAG: sigma 54-interacting transcriptional regulator [Dethiosulfatibacter sp.]|nr:sigma 54-interacting transcriptional regulator [Dethiosulfatibacter sp.]
MNLMLIQDVILKYSEAISTVLGVDVVIIDRYYNKIAYTTRNIRDAIPITRTSVVGEVMNTGEVLIVENNLNYPICQNCEDLSNCMIHGIISVPIILGKKSVGAVALLIPKGKKTNIFDNVSPAIDFVQIIADLIGSKLKNIEDVEKLKLTNYERDVIVNTIDDGIISFNNDGKVSYYNNCFISYFNITKTINDYHFEDLFHHPIIKEIFYSAQDETDKSFFYEEQGVSFLGIVTKKSIVSNGIKHGTLLIFKSINQSYNALNKVLDQQRHISFKNLTCLEKSFLEEIEKAKKIAVTNKEVLILGEEGLEQDDLARAIHNFSDRSDKGYRTIDFSCKTLKYIENSIVGSNTNNLKDDIVVGDLSMANYGTAYIKNIQDMPRYMQDIILGLLKNKSFYSKTLGKQNLDIRFIFHTTESLEQLVSTGYFNEELFYRIQKNILVIPPFKDRKHNIRQILNNTIEKLKIVYSKPDIRFSEEALKQLMEMRWPRNQYSMETVLGHIISLADNDIVGTSQMEEHLYHERNNFESYNVEELEKSIILDLLEQGYEKEEIAKKMGISRATLYRKLTKHNINE